MQKESQQFRENLAAQIKKIPKKERIGFYKKEKSEPEYWKSREEKIRHEQEETEIDNGLGILLKNKTLYHGSSKSGIKKFNLAEETTVGKGIYFTSEAEKAIGYGKERSNNKNNIIYEIVVNNFKLLNLRVNENIKKVFAKFKSVLQDKLDHLDPKKYNPMMFEVLKNSLEQAINNIEKGNFDSGSVRKIIFSPSGGVDFGYDFTELVKKMGYDGLVTFEGGEGRIGNHDTYLIFDPEKVKIIQEYKINS